MFIYYQARSFGRITERKLEVKGPASINKMSCHVMPVNNLFIKSPPVFDLIIPNMNSLFQNSENIITDISQSTKQKKNKKKTRRNFK